MANFGKIKIKPAGAKRASWFLLDIVRDETRPSGCRVVAGYRVNKQGERTGERELDGGKVIEVTLEVYIGVTDVVELVEDWKYGELVPVGEASQCINTIA